MKKNFTHNSKFFLILVSLMAFGACTEDYFPVPPQPPLPEVPLETTTLEAKYVTTPPISVTSAYWSQADYRRITVTNLSTGNLYTDGLLNMTGNYNGISGFNNGVDPKVTMKAAYDDQYVYMLIEWTDNQIDASNSSWLYNGPVDPLKADANGGWTSQRNGDKVSLAFEIASASSTAGNFSDVGCAASCHNNEMKPQAGTVDIWHWNLAHSEALGYASDMQTNSVAGLTFDAGNPIAVRNNIGTTDRSGPAFEWNGVAQDTVKPLGTAVILDPAYYLLNKDPFIGDPVLGDIAYHDAVKGCNHCHGENGEGGGINGQGPSFTRPEINRKSRFTFDQFAASVNHEGFTYYNQLNSTEKDNVIAFIRGYSGVPGYFLQTPDGSNADIEATSNTNLTLLESSTVHTQYKVLIKRALDTGNPDDAIFNLSNKMSYLFGIALMDNDGKNHIGSLKETVTFLPK